MTDSTFKKILAIGVIGAFLLIAIALTSGMLLGYVDPKEGMAILKDISGVFAGLIGLILGYYFGKKDA